MRQAVLNRLDGRRELIYDPKYCFLCDISYEQAAGTKCVGWYPVEGFEKSDWHIFPLNYISWHRTRN